MSFLLDTNVLSEGAKLPPDPRVSAWVASTDEDRLFVSVASTAEIRRGVERLPEGRRRVRYATWLAEDLPIRFAGRVLDIDHRIADRWGVLVARAQREGFTVDPMDAFLAATAATHGLILVTRNVRHFAVWKIPLVNPWDTTA